MGDADFVGKGEGIRYMPHLLGLGPDFDFFHPTVKSRIVEFLGVPMFPPYVGEICTGLGCRHGCDFCLTSASPHFAEINSYARPTRPPGEYGSM